MRLGFCVYGYAKLHQPAVVGIDVLAEQLNAKSTATICAGHGPSVWCTHIWIIDGDRGAVRDDIRVDIIAFCCGVQQKAISAITRTCSLNRQIPINVGICLRLSFDADYLVA